MWRFGGLYSAGDTGALTSQSAKASMNILGIQLRHQKAHVLGVGLL